MPTHSHRFGKTTLGVGVAAYYSFHDQPRDFDDFTRLYSRYLAGPARVFAWMDAQEQRRLRTLNWRVWGQSEPSFDAVAWGDPAHPNTNAPLGLWRVATIDMTALPEDIEQDSHLLNEALYAARDAVALDSRDAASADVRLPEGIDPRRWPKLLDVFRPEAWAERTSAELWCRNVVTDTGATAMLKNTFNNAGGAIGIMNHLVIAFGNQGYALQTGAAINNASGAQTSIATAGGVQVANLPANPQTITWSFGTTNAETWTLRTATPGNLGATSVLVNSQTTGGGLTHSAGDYIVLIPSTSDNPSSVSNSADSGALGGGAFTFSGTGVGNRQVQIQFTFNTSTAPGAYTEAYMSNAGTIAAGTTANHVIFPPQTINVTTSQQFNVVEKC